MHVAVRSARHAAACHDSKISRPILRAPDGTKRTTSHAVSAIEPAVCVNQQRPIKFDIVNVVGGPLESLERDDGNLQVECFEIRFVLLQLQHMFAARKSHQVPVKNQQQPASSKIIELPRPSVGVGQFELERFFSSPVFHLRLSSRMRICRAHGLRT